MDACKECNNASMEKCLMCKQYFYIKNSGGLSDEKPDKPKRGRKKREEWDEESLQEL